MMLSISPQMTIIAVCVLPVSMLLISIVMKRSQKYFAKQQQALGAVSYTHLDVYKRQGVENTIRNVARLGKIGMKETDKEIIKIMMDC